jgi:hypothetical protein
MSFRACRCGSMVLIMTTALGKRIAINPKPYGAYFEQYRSVLAQETYYIYGEHQPHVITCTAPEIKPPRKRYV